MPRVYSKRMATMSLSIFRESRMIEIFSSPSTSCQLTGTSSTSIRFLVLKIMAVLGSDVEQLAVEGPALQVLYGDDTGAASAEEFETALGILEVKVRRIRGCGCR
jgi:hypothetical protein